MSDTGKSDNPAAKEIELKLAVDPQDIDRLRRIDVIRAVRARGRRQTDTYYDTADLRLTGNGLHLRVRQVGRRFVQTLKTANHGGSPVQSRGEWSAVVPSLQPDLKAFGVDPTSLAPGPIENADLRPLFSASIARQTRLLTVANQTGGASRLELAIDRGAISCAGNDIPVCEVELELIEGSAAALYSTALAICREIPLRIAPLSKADRGYMLATAWRPSADVGVRQDLTERMTIGDAMAGIFGDCLTSSTVNEAAVVHGTDPEGVHKMRVGLRRLRSAFTLFRKAMEPASCLALNDEARWVLGSLGDARDWDVFLNETLTEVEAARPEDTDLTLLREVAERKRQGGYATARETLLSPRYCAFVLNLGQWIETRGWRGEAPSPIGQGPLSEFARRTLTKRFKAVRKLGKNLENLPPMDRHRLRIGVKKLRYAVEFFAGLFPHRETTLYLRRLSLLQEALGRMNDVSVMEARLSSLIAESSGDAALALGRASGKAIGWHAHAAAADEAKLAKHWKRVAKHDPFWIS